MKIFENFPQQSLGFMGIEYPCRFGEGHESTQLIWRHRSKQVQLEQLQARANTVNAAQALSHLSIDDSNLSHARKLINDLNKQLDVQQKMLDVEGKFVGLIPVETTAPVVTADIDKQIDAYFGETNDVATGSSMVYAE